MGNGVEVQSMRVVWACAQYKDIIIVHDSAIMESGKLTVLLRNDLNHQVGLIVDQHGFCVYL